METLLPEDVERLAKKEDMQKYAQCQKRLVIELFRSDKKDQEFQDGELTELFIKWTDSGYSKACRALVDEMKGKLLKGETLNYDQITLD